MKGHMRILLTILGILILTMTILTKARILSAESLQAVAFQMPVLGMLTLAQLIPMVTGGIDLSLVSNANLVGIITAVLLKRTGAAMIALPLGLGISMMVGILNGFLVSAISIPPIIATLSTMILAKGISLGITKGYIIADFPKWFLFLGNGVILGIPVPFLILTALSLIVSVVLNRTSYGIKVYMVGSNPIATEFSGVNVKAVLMRTYLISAVLSGTAGILMIARFNAAQAAYGESYLLLTVLACVLGGVDPSGGFGKVLGVFTAVAVLQMVETGFNLLRLSSHLANALWGIILIAVIMINRTLEGE